MLLTRLLLVLISAAVLISGLASRSEHTFLNSLIARFQSNGIRGYVLFTENGTSTSISTKIFNNADNNETYSWKIYNSGYMIDHSECNVRNNIYLSFDLTSLMGQLEPVKQNLFNVHLNFVTGEHSFLGKTLVLKGRYSGHMSCAIVLPFENKLTYSAIFRSEVQGMVYFLQSGSLFSLISSLHHSSPIEKTSFHDWAVLQVAVGRKDQIHDVYHKHEMNKCQQLNGDYLLRNNESNQVSISSEKSTLNSRSYINLRNVALPHTSASALFLVLSNADGVVVACAAIKQITAKRVIARFEEKHLVGQVMFSQESPIDPTLVDIELKSNKHAYSYGIDELPTISRSSEEPKKCANINNIIYNPSNISPFSVPIEGLGTSDQYAIGDLSGKYGTLLQKENEKISTVDFNLPLFGAHSIVGRALVWYAPNGSTVACANLDLSDAEMTIAFATFDRPVQGQVILKQRKNNCTDDTYVYFEISRSMENSSTSHGHDWSIRKNPIFTDSSWSTDECAQAGEIYNPYNKSADTVYQRDCNAANVVACKLGDMSKKLASVDIVPYKLAESDPNSSIQIQKYYRVDSFLPLCGPTSVVGKSIQINEQNHSSSALSCTNLVQLDAEDQDYQ